MSILLADDDVSLADIVSKSLESEGHEVHIALDQEAAEAELRRQNYKLIILDLNFGRTDGLELLAKWRSAGVTTPVIVLSARNRVSDRIQSLNLGADDYVTKPFSIQELNARVNALLRRKADPTLNVLRVEDLEMDPATRKVTRAGREIRLSSKEFHLLHLLMRHAGNQVTRQELLTEVWGAQPGSDSNLVDVYVNYLRRKIENFVDVRGEERIDEEKKLIHTVRGVGYRIGRETLIPKGAADAGQSSQEASRASKNVGQPGAGFSSGEPATLQQMPWRALVNSLAHDLAQPLTNVRCFLEVTAMRKGNLSMPANDLRNAEQQADRAIALEKTIAALVREVSVPSGPWISLNSLLEQVFENFNVLVQSGLLTLERRWDLSLQVTSNPVLAQLLVLLVGKLAGKNTVSITLTVTASRRDGKCHLELRWRPTEQGEVQEGEAVLSHDLQHIQEMVHSIGAELAFERPNGISLRLPTTQQPSPVGLQHSAVH